MRCFLSRFPFPLQWAESHQFPHFPASTPTLLLPSLVAACYTHFLPSVTSSCRPATVKISPWLSGKKHENYSISILWVLSLHNVHRVHISLSLIVIKNVEIPQQSALPFCHGQWLVYSIGVSVGLVELIAEGISAPEPSTAAPHTDGVWPRKGLPGWLESHPRWSKYSTEYWWEMLPLPSVAWDIPLRTHIILNSPLLQLKHP